MKCRFALLILSLAFLLGGCGLLRDGYVSVTPHLVREPQEDGAIVTVESFYDLQQTLKALVAEGRESALISVSKLNQDQVERQMDSFLTNCVQNDPIGAYAVDAISYELGSNAGQPTMALTITYVHGREEIRRIQNAEDVSQAQELIADALSQCAASVVLKIESYQELDFDQMIRDHADAYPESVMETPAVTVNIFPDSGRERVVELIFTYQNSRDSLRQMQNQVRPLFASAVLYVSGDGETQEKYSQLCSHLMERYDYTIETSITPAYSLLRLGVGDSKAFATVYAAMCRQAGLECQVITGTRGGAPHFWNLICVDGAYYHLDLLEYQNTGAFQAMTDQQMAGYVWDYYAYPAAPGSAAAPEE